MPDLILHHYPLSPFSEKVRRVLAYKSVPWRSVEQPMWNPKPKLTALTGGYRRIPVMQIGADVYCDTACILRTLEALHPTPTIFPDGQRGEAEIMAWWADRQLFTVAAGMVLATVGQTLPPAFKADREKMVPGLRIDDLPAMAPHAQSQFRVYCQSLERQLTGRRFLLGEAFSLADAACYHALWFARMDASAAAISAQCPALQAWFARVEAFGSGQSTPLAPDDAIAIARAATPAIAIVADPADPSGFQPGDTVTVTPDDYALDPVAGELVALGTSDVAIRRSDPEAGEVVVHFPRAGFRLAPARAG